MATPESLSGEVQRLVELHMASGLYASSDELLVTALHQLPFGDVDESEVAAIQEGLDAHASGEKAVELQAAFLSLREKYGVPSDS
jgi:Arc/MetJ-type ribon-helix-helix transcriptional regulator